MRLFDAELYCEDDFDPRPYQTCVDITSLGYLVFQMLKRQFSRGLRENIEQSHVWKQSAQHVAISRDLLEDFQCPT